nr:hypothetical protein [Polymorphobacter sp.]
MIIPLPYGLWDATRHITSLTLKPITGADELALAEALADGATPAAAGNLLLARCTSADEAATAHLTLGDRETLLRALHVQNFGAHISAQTPCDSCGETIEYDLDLTHPPESPPEPGPRHHLPGTTIEIRLLTAADLETAATAADPTGILLTAATGTAQLPPETIATALTHLDPNAETRLTLECPACAAANHRWLDSFDLIRRALGVASGGSAATFNGGILAQIHLLASRYGWSETDILALPRRRRLRYCAMATA